MIPPEEKGDNETLKQVTSRLENELLKMHLSSWSEAYNSDLILCILFLIFEEPNIPPSYFLLFLRTFEKFFMYLIMLKEVWLKKKKKKKKLSQIQHKRTNALFVRYYDLVAQKKITIFHPNKSYEAL